MLKKSETFHSLAKDAGNRLRTYILSVSSGAIGVLFFVLTNQNTFKEAVYLDKIFFIAGLLGFSFTVALSLFELRIDAKRFFYIAKEEEKKEEEQDWLPNEKYKKQRYALIRISYFTFGVGIIAMCSYLILSIIKT